MFAVLHLTDVIARFFPGGIEGGSKDGPEAIQFGMEVLTQSRSGFPVAGPLQEMLRKSANECAIRLPKNLMDLMTIPRPPKNLYKMDDLIDACTRPNYVQPVDEIRLRYLPSFAADWTIDASSFGFLELNSSDRGGMRIPSAEERGAQSLMQIRNLLNTI
jgi:hypothetical protein